MHNSTTYMTGSWTSQMVEGSLYGLFGLVACVALSWYLLTRRRRREANWPHPPLLISQAKHRAAVKTAFAQNAIVLGYDVHGKPWFWPDATRVMQSVVFGATGSGKTTLLKNIINGSRRCRVCLSLGCAMVIIRRRHSQQSEIL